MLYQAGGNILTLGIGDTFQIVDTTAPSVPAQLAATNVQQNSADLSWQASTDNVGVVGYELELTEGVLPAYITDLGNVLSNSLSGLSPDTLHAVRVRAYDAVGNRSAWSSEVQFTTPDIGQAAPSAPQNFFAGTPGPYGAPLTWQAPATGVVIGYELEVVLGSNPAYIVNVGNFTSFTLSGLVSASAYTVRVRAYTTDGTRGDYSDAVAFTTAAAPSVDLRLITEEGNNLPPTTANYPRRTDSPFSSDKTWQLWNTQTTPAALAINGGHVPSDYMIQETRPSATPSQFTHPGSAPSGYENVPAYTGAPRWPGRNYIHCANAIGYAVGSDYRWGTPGVFDPSNPTANSVVINSSNAGPFRNHFSFNQVLNMGQDDPVYGRRAGILRAGGFDFRLTECNPFLEPLSNGSTKMNGDLVENVLYEAFSVRFVLDETATPFYFPGQSGVYTSPSQVTYGDINQESTDGPHYAINFRQGKGKQSGVVTWNMKWQGERIVLIQQLPNGNVAERAVLFGPGGGLFSTDRLNSVANTWLDFIVKVVPGQASTGDSPEMVIWMKLGSQSTYTEVYRRSYDLLSEIETLSGGIPLYYYGAPGNGGLYESTRKSGWANTNRWNAWVEHLGTTCHHKIDHSESWVYDHSLHPSVSHPSEAEVVAAFEGVFSPV